MDHPASSAQTPVMAPHLYQTPMRNIGPEVPPPVRALFMGTATTLQPTEPRRPAWLSQSRPAAAQRHATSRQRRPQAPAPEIPGNATPRPRLATANRTCLVAWPSGPHQASLSTATPQRYQRSVAASQDRYPKYDYCQWAQSLRHTVNRAVTPLKPPPTHNTARSMRTATHWSGAQRPMDRVPLEAILPSLLPTDPFPESTEDQDVTGAATPTPTSDGPVAIVLTSGNTDEEPEADTSVFSTPCSTEPLEAPRSAGSVATVESSGSSTAIYTAEVLTDPSGDKALAMESNNIPFGVAADIVSQLADLPESWFSQLESTVDSRPEMTPQIPGTDVATIPAYPTLPMADSLITNPSGFLELANDLSWLQALPETGLANNLSAVPAQTARLETLVNPNEAAFGASERSTHEIPSAQCIELFPTPGPSIATCTPPSPGLSHAQSHLATPEPRTRRLSGSSVKSSASSAGSCRCDPVAGEAGHALCADTGSPYFLRSHCRSRRCMTKLIFTTQSCSPTTQRGPTVTRPAFSPQRLMDPDPSHSGRENTGPSAQPLLSAPVAPRRKKSRRSRRRRVILPVTAPEHPSRGQIKTSPPTTLPTSQLIANPLGSTADTAVPNVPLSYELRNRTVQPPSRPTKRPWQPAAQSGENSASAKPPSQGHKSRKLSRSPSTTGVASRLRSRITDQ
ncbi:hypothetical protein H4R34_000315 [Dimargaris verticillata]|uniref:Uncharacterized protein n=1 Tax=Dimargaris verticillata TaxID=2761393 RepID=A0A9W8BAM3_9FUNG|nr:hypothetical protein H4R34_000315 [Dimargaris verticillata]